MQPHSSHSSRENATPSSGTFLLASCKGVPPPPAPGSKLWKSLMNQEFIDLVHNVGLLIYSLICIILSDLLSRRKTQKNSYFQTGSERLIIIHIEEYLKLKAGLIGQQNVTKLFAQYFDLTKLVFIRG